MPFLRACSSMCFCHLRCPAESVAYATFRSSLRRGLDLLSLVACLDRRDRYPTASIPAISAMNSQTRHTVAHIDMRRPCGAPKMTVLVRAASRLAAIMMSLPRYFLFCFGRQRTSNPTSSSSGTRGPVCPRMPSDLVGSPPTDS